MSYKKILTIQDLSCVGQCSLTVALPILSACGLETCILPSAVLSTHTAGFSGFTFRDLTDDMPAIQEHWKKENIKFKAIYTGYLGSIKQVGYVRDILKTMGTEDCVRVVDPAMADNGQLYKGFTPEFAAAMAKLCGKADIIVPNLTEACFMLGIPYTTEYDEEYIRRVLKQLTGLGAKRAALTGISFDPNKLGSYAYDSTTDTYFCYYNDRMPVAYHGTGDIFASATLGALMRDHSLDSALSVAVDFTLECIKLTMADENRRTYGVNFEEALPYYIERLKK